MGVVCQILINKTKESVHKAGGTVTGAVKYTIDQPTEYKAMTLSLLGAGKCNWMVSDSRTTRILYGSEEYITVHQDLLNNKTDTTFINVGFYEFKLPENLPSSFEDSYCTISYHIQLKLIKPKVFGGTQKFTTEIPVCGYVEATKEGPVTFGLEKTLTKLFSAAKPVINLKAEIVKASFLPGENAQLSLTVTNNTDLTPAVYTTLYCHIIYTANCGTTTTSVQKINDCSSEMVKLPKRGVASFSQTIPTSSELCSITSEIMKKEYRLRVTVKLPMPHKNVFVEKAVTIGKRKGVDSMEEASSLASTEAEMVNSPTSYWEVMREDQDKKSQDPIREKEVGIVSGKVPRR